MPKNLFGKGNFKGVLVTMKSSNINQSCLMLNKRPNKTKNLKGRGSNRFKRFLQV